MPRGHLGARQERRGQRHLHGNVEAPHHGLSRGEFARVHAGGRERAEGDDDERVGAHRDDGDCDGSVRARACVRAGVSVWCKALLNA